MADGKNKPILIVTPFHHGAGGVAMAVRQLAIEFRAIGHPVIILTRGRTATVVPDSEEDGVYRIRLRIPYGSPLSWLAFVLFLPVTLLSLRIFLAQHQISIVLIQYSVPRHFYFGVLRWFARWKLFVAFQGRDGNQIAGRGFLHRAFYNVLLRSADGVSAVANSLLQKVRAVVPAASRHNAIIPNGAPALVLAPDATDGEDSYAITVGLLIRRKGIDVLIRAVGILKRRGVRQRLLVVGAGPERDSLEALARKESVLDDVVFVGEKSHAEVLALVSRSRYFVLASRAEGLPLVLVEAMMCARPVIATNVDGIPEIVTHDSTGLLVEPERETQLADAMHRLIENDALRRQLGAAARGVAENFEWRRIAMRYIEHFGTVAKTV
jgi:glycosyltransferase involved in cell wall biosynthesis